jgi:prepilin-type N-terminal cleavage/methylation domain-containing protein
MPTLNKTKKINGLTLVEVVVALSLFAIVFTGVATLIISVVNLAVISKERTEAITYAQKGLALRLKSLDYGCSVKD